MNIRHLDQIVALCLTGFGAYLIWAGIDYGLMRGTTPGAGYFPALIGGLIVVLSIVNLARSLGGIEKVKATMSRREVAQFIGIVVAMLVFVFITPWLGMTLAAMLLMPVTAFIIRPSTDRRFVLQVVLVSVLAPIICKFAFGELLNVPIPTGVFGF